MENHMTTGRKIRAVRRLRGMTQKRLGVLIGFPENAADVRIAQYESGARGIKPSRLQKIAEVLGVPAAALRERRIYDHWDVAHTLFGLEDEYGLLPMKALLPDGTPIVTLGFVDLVLMYTLEEWESKRREFGNGLCSEEDYNSWKAAYPIGAQPRQRYY